jgi:hypothetical protein
MANQHQQELRRAAAKAFMRSLDELHDSLQKSDSKVVQPPRTNGNEPNSSTSLHFDLNTFEQAVADIEEFIERQKEKEMQPEVDLSEHQ